MPEMRERVGLVGAIVRKDLKLFARDRFYAFMSVIGLVFYVGIFWLLPATVDETVRLGVTGGDLGPLLEVAAASQEGLELERFDSVDDLRSAVLGEGDDPVAAGVELPERFVQRVQAGERVTVRLFLGTDVPAEFRGTVGALVEEVGFLLAGQPPPVEFRTQDLVLGTDRADDPVPLRERMRPLLVFAALLVEMLALAALVAEEISTRTVTAVLVTPARPLDLMAGKALLGTGLAFGQAFLLLLATGSLALHPGLLLVATLLGAVLVTGFGLLAGSTGRDFIGIIFWSMLLLIPMLIPAIATLFPGRPAVWVRALPTYGLVEAIVGATTEGLGWIDALPDLGLLFGWCVAAFAIGVLALSRKVARL